METENNFTGHKNQEHFLLSSLDRNWSLLNYYLLNNIMFYVLPYDDFSIRRVSFGRYLYRFKSMLSCHMRLCRFINIYLAKLREGGGTTQNSLLDTTINFTCHYINVLNIAEISIYVNLCLSKKNTQKKINFK